MIYGQIRQDLVDILHELARQKESRIVEGHLMAERVHMVHMLIEIPPKYSVAHVVGFMKGKSAIYVARHYGNRKRNVRGKGVWARG